VKGFLIAVPLLLLPEIAAISFPPDQSTEPKDICASKTSAQPEWRTVTAVSGQVDMAFIAGATFQMGVAAEDLQRLQEFFEIKDPRFFDPEVPKHTVTIDSFYLDKRLVTNEEFEKFTRENPSWHADRIPAKFHNGHYLEHWNANGAPPERAKHPVVNVSWHAAVAYCQWEGKRLPTEAEWEFAAKGRLNGVFPWGDEAANQQMANYARSGIRTTTAVGSYPANGYGLFDMAGNVWEYLADEWAPYRSDAQTNLVAGGDYFASGDSYQRVTTRRVIRGGSWGGSPVNLWVEYRDSHPPNNAKDFVGFRCARTATK